MLVGPGLSRLGQDSKIDSGLRVGSLQRATMKIKKKRLLGLCWAGAPVGWAKLSGDSSLGSALRFVGPSP